MFGQWCDPLGGAWLPCPGAVGVVRDGAVDDVVVPLPVEVDVDVAALAIAAPAPASAAVAATVTSMGLNLRIWSPPFSWTAADVPRAASEPGRRHVRVCYE
jgi:hypothetical protein